MREPEEDCGKIGNNKRKEVYSLFVGELEINIGYL